MDNQNQDMQYNCYMLDTNIGLEKESLRVDADGKLAQTPHPFPGDPHIDRDFSENQTEFITGIYDTPGAVVDELTRLHSKAAKKLLKLPTGPEYLWPFSNPPKIVSDKENPPAEFLGEDRWKTEYRYHLRERYGTRLMLYSGIHFNMSFTDEFLNRLSVSRNNAYLNLSAWALRYAWLVIYLTAASPVIDPSFFTNPKEAEKARHHYSSPRSSRIGYWNTFDPVLDYSSLDRCIDSIEAYVNDGSLMYPAELYYPVRLKPAGRYDMDALRENGISHIEIRVVDENPYSPIGIFKEDVQFLHLLMVFLMYRTPKEFTAEEQLVALHDMKAAALYNDRTVLSNGKSIWRNARDTLHEMYGFFRRGAFSRIEKAYIQEALNYQAQKLERGKRTAERVRQDFDEDYMEKGLALAKAHSDALVSEI